MAGYLEIITMVSAIAISAKQGDCAASGHWGRELDCSAGLGLGMPAGGVGCEVRLWGCFWLCFVGAIVSIAGFGPKPSTRFSGWPWALEGTWRPKADVGDPCGLRLVEALI